MQHCSPNANEFMAKNFGSYVHSFTEFIWIFYIIRSFYLNIKVDGKFSAKATFSGIVFCENECEILLKVLDIGLHYQIPEREKIIQPIHRRLCLETDTTSGHLFLLYNPNSRLRKKLRDVQQRAKGTSICKQQQVSDKKIQIARNIQQVTIASDKSSDGKY